MKMTQSGYRQLFLQRNTKFKKIPEFMINKHLNQINDNDLENLIANSIPESKTIEYKRDLPGNSDNDRKEFLADISSFANSSGGDLIFGIAEEGGIPVSIDGIDITDLDKELLKYEGIIRDGLEPRITFSIGVIRLKNKRVVLIFRVLKSWTSPHRVIYKSHDKFYGRNSAGKYALDTTELRVVFNLTKTITEEVKNFRIDRISQLLSNNTPIPFRDKAKIVLHFIPLESFNPSFQFDIKQVNSAQLRPMYCMGWNDRINLEGFLTYSQNTNGESYSYVQLYRNGIIEIVNGSILKDDAEEKYIPSIAYEKEILETVKSYIEFMKNQDIPTPVVMCLTLIGVKDFKISDQKRSFTHETFKIDKEILQLPEIIIETYEDINILKMLKPIFDLIWNSCGYEGSLNFSEDGNWVNR